MLIPDIIHPNDVWIVFATFFSIIGIVFSFAEIVCYCIIIGTTLPIALHYSYARGLFHLLVSILIALLLKSMLQKFDKQNS